MASVAALASLALTAAGTEQRVINTEAGKIALTVPNGWPEPERRVSSHGAPYYKISPPDTNFEFLLYFNYPNPKRPDSLADNGLEPYLKSSLSKLTKEEADPHLSLAKLEHHCRQNARRPDERARRNRTNRGPYRGSLSNRCRQCPSTIRGLLPSPPFGQSIPVSSHQPAAVGSSALWNLESSSRTMITSLQTNWSNAFITPLNQLVLGLQFLHTAINGAQKNNFFPMTFAHLGRKR